MYSFNWTELPPTELAKRISFGEPRKTDRGTFINLTVKGQKVEAQTPKMKVPFGARAFDDDSGAGKQQKWKLALEFSSNTRAMKDFKMAIQELDKQIVDYAFKNQQELFNTSNKSREVIMDRYLPVLHDKDTQYDPQLRTDIEVVSGIFKGDIFDAETQAALDINKVTPTCSVDAVVEFGPIWCNSMGKFGLKKKTTKIQVHQIAAVSQFPFAAIPTDKDEEMVEEE